MNRQLTLIVPGLTEITASEALSSCTTLHKLTSRAVRIDSLSDCYEQALMSALGYPVPNREGLPGAQCTHLTDFNESVAIHCCRADPVHLIAEQDHGRLVPADALAIDPDDAHEIVNDLNTLYAEDDLYFSIGQKDRWYVSGKPAAALDSAPTSLTAGRNVASFLPLSVDAATWRQLASEVQMFLHTHPVNQKRTAEGRRPINALWFWGAGKLQPRSAGVEYRLFSNAAFAVGLASLSGMTSFPLQDIHTALGGKTLAMRAGASAPSVECSHVVVLETALLETILSGDLTQQADLLASFEHKLFSYAYRLLKNGSVQSVVIDTCAGHLYRLSRLQLFRFWARQPVLASQASNSEYHDVQR